MYRDGTHWLIQCSINSSVSLRSFSFCDISFRSPLFMTHFPKVTLSRFVRDVIFLLIARTSSRQLRALSDRRFRCATVLGDLGTTSGETALSVSNSISIPMHSSCRARTCSGASLKSLRISFISLKTVNPNETMPMIALAGSITSWMRGRRQRRRLWGRLCCAVHHEHVTRAFSHRMSMRLFWDLDSVSYVKASAVSHAFSRRIVSIAQRQQGTSTRERRFFPFCDL